VWPEKDLFMTTARALKQIIRARAARTGERYTAARRQVLKDLEGGKNSAPPPSAATAPAMVPTRPSKGGLSDPRTVERTGHGLDHWFAVLDRFGAVEKGHTAAARHLRSDHDVSGWYAQGITVAYERARGVRAANQRCDGEFEVSVSKTIAAGVPEIARLLTNSRLRRKWLNGVEPALAAALTKAFDTPASKGVVVRADGQGRFRYKWDDTVVQIYLLPKAAGKVSVVVTNAKLASAAAVEERRGAWRAALNALSLALSPKAV
jgi:hypothetical protein